MINDHAEHQLPIEIRYMVHTSGWDETDLTPEQMKVVRATACIWDDYLADTPIERAFQLVKLMDRNGIIVACRTGFKVMLTPEISDVFDADTVSRGSMDYELLASARTPEQLVEGLRNKMSLAIQSPLPFFDEEADPYDFVCRYDESGLIEEFIDETDPEFLEDDDDEFGPANQSWSATGAVEEFGGQVVSVQPDEDQVSAQAKFLQLISHVSEVGLLLPRLRILNAVTGQECEFALDPSKMEISLAEQPETPAINEPFPESSEPRWRLRFDKWINQILFTMKIDPKEMLLWKGSGTVGIPHEFADFDLGPNDELMDSPSTRVAEAREQLWINFAPPFAAGFFQTLDDELIDSLFESATEAGIEINKQGLPLVTTWIFTKARSLDGALADLVEKADAKGYVITLAAADEDTECDELLVSACTPDFEVTVDISTDLDWHAALENGVREIDQRIQSFSRLLSGSKSHSRPNLSSTVDMTELATVRYISLN